MLRANDENEDEEERKGYVTSRAEPGEAAQSMQQSRPSKPLPCPRTSQRREVSD